MYRNYFGRYFEEGGGERVFVGVVGDSSILGGGWARGVVIFFMGYFGC